MQFVKEINKILNMALNILAAVLAIFLIFTGILYLFGLKSYSVQTGSMEPTIHTGSMCYIDKRISYEEIREGDIVAFEKRKNYRVIHRVISITNKGLETQGDANDISDGISTSKENFIGKYVFSIPYVGYALDWVKKPSTLLILAAIMLANEFITNRMEKEKKNE